MRTVRARSLVERLEAGTASCDGVEAVARAVFDAVAADVPFDFACLATTDPTSQLITAAYKSRPLPIGDEEFAAAEYGAPDVNQLAEIARRPVPVGGLSIDTGGHPEMCRRFRDYMAPRFGFTDELRVACRVGGRTWGALALYRGAGEPPFGERDVEVLAEVHHLVADGLRRALFAGGPSGEVSPSTPAVLIIDARDRATGMTAAAQAHIEDLGGWDHGALPTNLLAVAALARRTGRPATTRALGRSGAWLSLRAMTLDDGSADRSLVISVDTAPQPTVGEMRLAAQGLTAREQEVARLVLQGASTKDLAASLYLSPHTVQDHLKAIFAKLGVNSRREMIAQLVVPVVAADPTTFPAGDGIVTQPGT